jgi:SAM-dependent methyltransferase
MAYEPATALDAGCGTGRVGIELARRGVAVVGVDLEPGMLTTARDRAPEVEWIEGDLTSFDLATTFDVVVMAGNVMLFVGDRAAAVARCAAHLPPGGRLVAGFQLHGMTTPSGHRLDPFELVDYDAAASAAGLVLEERFATWDREPYDGGSYAVSVHRAVEVSA